MAVNIEVWIFAEHTGSELKDITIELASEGRKIADKLQGRLCAVVLGSADDSLFQALGSYLVDRVYAAFHQALASTSTEIYACLIIKLLKQKRPEIMLFGATALGSDLGPRIAAGTEASFTGNCDFLDIDGNGSLVATKPIYGGRLHATYAHTGNGLKVATLNPGVVGMVEAKGHHMPEIVWLDLQVDPGYGKTKVADYIKGDPRTMDLTEAEIIVCGGRGFGDEEGFQLLYKLADVLGASVSGTRMVTDAGWLPRERQVGQTGKTVSPKIYFACGISGATQHVMGMKDSKLIVAINSDKDAPIFKTADLKIVGDVHRVLPVFIDKLAHATNS